MVLTEAQFLEGSFGLIWVVIATIIGVRIITKAISRSRNELITVGLTWIFISSAWWGVAVQFITFGFFNYKLSDFQYLFIANVFIPFGLICWIYSFCHIINPNLKKNFFLINVAFFIIWEIYLLISLFIDTKLVGRIEGIFDSTHSIIQLIFVFSAIIIFLSTGVFFSIKSMKVDDPEIKWKGTFLLIAWFSFTIGALLDAALPLTAITLIIVRLILISSSIEFYLGFFLPEKLAKWLIG